MPRPGREESSAAAELGPNRRGDALPAPAEDGGGDRTDERGGGKQWMGGGDRYTDDQQAHDEATADGRDGIAPPSRFGWNFHTFVHELGRYKYNLKYVSVNYLSERNFSNGGFTTGGQSAEVQVMGAGPTCGDSRQGPDHRTAERVPCHNRPGTGTTVPGFTFTVWPSVGQDMADDGERDGATLPPDDAFALLGNGTRIEILHVLGDVDEPLAFSTLYDEVDMNDSGQFNYHLEKLVGHFVRKTADGYTLTRMGRRVVEAVLSGAVTETPTMERTPVAESCEYCGGAMEISWQGGSVRMYCTECAGRYGQARAGGGGSVSSAEGYLGRLPLPPAGVRGRTPIERLRAAWTWGGLEVAALSTGICPRCSATVERTVTACGSHDASEGLCETCLRAEAIEVKFACTNCIYRSGGAAPAALYANTELLAFLTTHGLNPIAPDSIHALNRTLQNYEEEILSADPLRARLTFSADGETLSLTVDEELTVVESSR